ncbi:transcriptional regulator of nitric oxide reductase [Arthrobacter pascens]|nr:transcriptional regulator of nitric oxide reductase [Arthrobacter pascens]
MAVAATENVLRVRVTTRSLLRKVCPARVEAVPTATVRVVRVPQPVRAAPVRVVRVPQRVPVAPVRVVRVQQQVPVARVPREPVETVLLRA